MIKAVFALATLVLASGAAAGPPAHFWEIGPVIRGKNYSINMPTTMREGADGPMFAFPSNGGEVHYVTTKVRSLADASQIRIRYRIDARRGAKIIPSEYPEKPATLSLYLQRRGDNWSARGRYETYRWYVTSEKMLPLVPGTHEVTVDLKSDWRAVLGTTAQSNPAAFRDALVNADEVGFVFGSAGGRGHGVYSTAPATFTLLNFDIR